MEGEKLPRPEEASGHEGLAGTFRDKVISIDTLELRLLAPIAGAIAIVVGSAVLLATRDAGWPRVSVGAPEGGVVASVPLPVAVLATVAMVFAWSFILAGALHAHLALRILGVGAYAVLGLLSAILSQVPLVGLIITLVVLSVVVAAIGLYVTDRGNRDQAPHLHHRARLRLPTFGWVLFTTTLIYGLLAEAGLQNGHLGFFVDFELYVLQLALIPVLLIAGTDFAEWAEVVSGRLSSLVEKLPRPAIVAAIVVAGGSILAWTYVVRAGRPQFFAELTVVTLVPVAILAVPVCAVGGLALRRPLSTRVPFWALAAGAFVLYLVLLLPAAAAAIGNPAVIGPQDPQDLPRMVAAQSLHAPRYSLLVPQSWTRTAIEHGAVWSGNSDGRPARLALLWSPAPIERSLSLALATPVTLQPGVTTDGWRSASIRTRLGVQPAQGDVWTKREGGRTWVLAGVRAAGGSVASRSLFDTVRASFTTDPGTQDVGPVAPNQYNLVWGGGAVLILLGVGLALLVAGRDEAATGGLYLVLVALFAGLGPEIAPPLAALVGVHGVRGVVPSNVDVAGAYVALGALALTSIVPGWRLPVAMLRLILVLTLGLAGLHVLFDGVFSTALAAGARITLVQGVVLLAAMAWDFLMSGETFTNTGGSRFPRHSRVLIYMGYTLLVVTAVLFLSSTQAEGGGNVGLVFESDIWPQLGIAALGPPLLVTFFLVNLRAWRRAGSLPGVSGLDGIDRSVLLDTSAEDASGPGGRR